MTPFDDIWYLFNNIVLGEEPVSLFKSLALDCSDRSRPPLQTAEDWILLIGTFVAFIAFVLWCCFPVVPKDSMPASSNPPPDYEATYRQLLEAEQVRKPTLQELIQPYDLGS